MAARVTDLLNATRTAQLDRRPSRDVYCVIVNYALFYLSTTQPAKLHDTLSTIGMEW